MASVGDKLRHAWNAFTAKEDTPRQEYGEYASYGSGFSVRPYATRASINSSRTIVTSIYTRLAIDVAAIPILHVKVDGNDRYIDTVKSGLHNCLTMAANIDQGATACRQDSAYTLFEKGVMALVPIDTTLDPTSTGGYDIQTMRVGHVVQWFPKHVRVSVYNEATGLREELMVPKSIAAIVENPLYMVMNETNSTLQRLVRKLSLLDAVDEQSNSGKLDLIIQLPYTIRSDARRDQAEKRRKDIEMQLQGAQYGIAYTDGTEKITQLNRPAENNLMAQVEYLQEMLYSQLGLTKEVFDGTADEKTMVNYFNRTIEPILTALTEAMTAKFLTKTARTQGHRVRAYRDPFKFLTLATLAEVGDKLTRNEIASSNEVRAVIGWKPSSDPKADELRNKNLPLPPGEVDPSEPS